jgi:2-isopropylmalate synthase
VGIHTHNDGGVGVANALAAVRAGACQVQGTINGYGERVGNCNLITVMPNLQLKMGIELGVDLTRLRELSYFVDELANVPHDIRAPYVGLAAFTHKGGLHVHAVQKLARTYEHVDPSLVGNERVITISDMSGQSERAGQGGGHGAAAGQGLARSAEDPGGGEALESEGYEFEAAEASFELLIRRQLGQETECFELLEFHTTHRCRPGRHGDQRGHREAAGQRQAGIHRGRGRRPGERLDKALRKACCRISRRSPTCGWRTTRCASSTAAAARRRRRACSLSAATAISQHLGHGGSFDQCHRRQLAGAGGQPGVLPAEPSR